MSVRSVSEWVALVCDFATVDDIRQYRAVVHGSGASDADEACWLLSRYDTRLTGQGHYNRIRASLVAASKAVDVSALEDGDIREAMRAHGLRIREAVMLVAGANICMLNGGEA